MGRCVEGEDLLRFVRDRLGWAASLLWGQPAFGAVFERRDELG
jgi:hypothetical protein